MVKKLFLLRHGHASGGYQMNDFDRPLSSLGIEGIEQLSINLKSKSFEPNKLLVSPAVRTKETCSILVENLSINSPLEYVEGIYEACVQFLFKLIASVESSVERLLVIGHNPGLSYLVEYMTGRAYVGMAPGQLVQLVFEIDDWNEVSKGNGKIQSYL